MAITKEHVDYETQFLEPTGSGELSFVSHALEPSGRSAEQISQKPIMLSDGGEKFSQELEYIHRIYRNNKLGWGLIFTIGSLLAYDAGLPFLGTISLAFGAYDLKNGLEHNRKAQSVSDTTKSDVEEAYRKLRRNMGVGVGAALGGAALVETASLLPVAVYYGTKTWQAHRKYKEFK